MLVGRVDRAEDVILDAVTAQRFPAALDLAEGALSTLVEAVGIVDFFRPVDAEPNEEIVLFQKGAPCIVQQDAIGLERIFNLLTRLAILLGEFNGALEEIQAH